MAGNTVTPNFRLNEIAFDTSPWDVAMNANFSILDGVLSRYLAISNFVGVWANATAYSSGNQVIDSTDSSLWFCNIQHTSAASPTTFAADRIANSTYWSQSIASAPQIVNSQSDNTGRNFIHNPFFNIQQRGSGPWTVSTFTADRWLCIISGSDTSSHSIVTLADADRTGIGNESAKFALQRIFTGSAVVGSSSDISQSTEDVRRLSGKTVTVSFYAKATSGAPKIGVILRQSFGSGGSPSADVNTSAGLTAALSTTWTRYSQTVTLPSISGKTLGTSGDRTILDFVLSDAGNTTYGIGIGVQSGTIRLWGVQLEIGSSPTTLETRDPVLDLALCQRFYQVGLSFIAGGGFAGQNVGYAVAFPVSMRAAPTITQTGGSVANAASWGTTQITTGGFISIVVATATAFTSFNITYSASADL